MKTETAQNTEKPTNLEQTWKIKSAQNLPSMDFNVSHLMLAKVEKLIQVELVYWEPEARLSWKHYLILWIQNAMIRRKVVVECQIGKMCLLKNKVKYPYQKKYL